MEGIAGGGERDKLGVMARGKVNERRIRKMQWPMRYGHLGGRAGVRRGAGGGEESVVVFFTCMGCNSNAGWF